MNWLAPILQNLKPILIILLIIGTSVVAVIFLSPSPKIDLDPNVLFAFDVAAAVSLDTDLLECLESGEALSIDITKPKHNATLEVSANLKVRAKHTFDCYDTRPRDIRVSWLVDGDLIPNMKTLSGTISELSVGDHEITIIAKYQEFVAEDTAEIEITRRNRPPVTGIIKPSSGVTLYANTTCSFSSELCATLELIGRSEDPEDGLLAEQNVKWYSIRNGVKTYLASGIDHTLTGTGALEIPLIENCSSTTYQILLEGTDSKGLVGSDSVSITVSQIC